MAEQAEPQQGMVGIHHRSMMQLMYCPASIGGDSRQIVSTKMHELTLLSGPPPYRCADSCSSPSLTPDTHCHVLCTHHMAGHVSAELLGWGG